MSGAEIAVKSFERAARVPRVLIVTENASLKFGGEAALPFQYFDRLRKRGVDVWLVTHSRVRDELRASFPDDIDRLFFVEDSRFHRFLWAMGQHLQPRLRYVTQELFLRFVTQRAQLRLARKLVKTYAIDVVHQPTPVSPREPSLLTKLGAPVVIGPMNCAVDYPPAFRHLDFPLTRALVWLARATAPVMSFIFAGKREAALLLVANERSRAALVGGNTAKLSVIPENGIDLDIWRPRAARPAEKATCGFVFVGRLILSKGVDLFLQAFETARAQHPTMSALVVGDGPELEGLQKVMRARGLLSEVPDEPGKVCFTGWRTHAQIADLLRTQDCFVFPTLFECGGAVVLEAMAMRLPVIASGWGGPADYIDPSCGELITEESPQKFVDGLVAAMLRLARDPALRERMGAAGRRKVEEQYTWDSKIDHMIDFYRLAMDEQPVEQAVGTSMSRAAGYTGSAMLLWGGEGGEIG